MKRVLSAVSIVVIIAALAYGVFALQKANAPAPPSVVEAAISSVRLTTSYEDGVHQIDGALTVPDACTTLDASVIASPGGIRVDLSRMRDEGICLERAQELTFSLSVEAEEEAPIKAFVDGKEALITPYAD